ncbi:MAG: hypothetical protein P8M22_06895 [Phycisphaerales bacterium]|nr:hypothetical protein [Phycisphaerales bacterium]
MGHNSLHIRRYLLLICILLGAVTEAVSAQAFCALRDPVSRVYELFPEATSYRTVIGTVGPQHRQFLAKNLPFPHHFNEFGRHSLYVALQDGRPLGLVHVRSEKGRWGLVEICWALDLDLNVIGFEFQRCRGPHCDAISEGIFLKHVSGSKFDSLKEGLRSETIVELLPESQRALAETVLRSGLKTIALTSAVWREELIELRAPIQARSTFGDEVTLEQQSQDVTTAGNIGFIMNIWGDWIIKNQKGEVRGQLILTSVELPGFSDDLWWAVDSDGVLIKISSQHGWPDEMTRLAFEELIGRDIRHFKDCATAAELAAEAVLVKQELP